MHKLTSRHQAEAWLATQPAPKPRRRHSRLGWLLLTLLASVVLTDAERGEPQVQQPTAPTSYARLSLYVAAFVGWVLLGTLLAKCDAAPLPTPSTAPQALASYFK